MKKLIKKLSLLKRLRKSDSIPDGLGDQRVQGTVPRIRYSLVENQQTTKRLFQRMKQTLVDRNNESRQGGISTPKLRYEWGVLPEGREYFYLQPWDSEGFLFEEASKGWVISRAHKITEKQQFMRESEAWDVVNVFESLEADTLPRLSSKRFGDELMSYSIYQDSLIASFGDQIGMESP